jgi:hydroxymethylpyrimidine pyrophosphatase-like HAD family hydrolase
VKALRWQLSMQIDGAARIMQAGVSEMLEVLPKGGSKGAALRTLLKDLKLSPEQVMAVGDGENDIEMLRLAGVGVAVSNAQSILKEAADHVTTASYGDGVAEAIEQFVLKNASGGQQPEAQEAESTPQQAIETEVEKT